MKVVLDHHQDFWELNPGLDVIFDKHDSDFMWAIAYFTHPDSELAFYDKPQRKELINKNILRGEKLDWESESVQEIIHLFKEGVLSRTQKHVILWRDKMEERDDLMRKTPYTMQTKDDLDKMLKESRYLWPQLEEAEEKLLKDTMSSQVEGGGEESLSDKNLL